MSKDKVKKPFYKKWWVWLIAIIIIIGFSTNGGEEDGGKEAVGEKSAPASSTPKENPKKEPEKVEPKKEEPKVEPKSFVIGDTVPVGKMIYTINGIETADQVGNEYFPEVANGTYVVIDITIKNDGNKAVTVDASFFKLKRGEKIYEAETLASMYANQEEDGKNNSFFLQKLNPDSEMTGKVVFDVAPEVAESNELQIQVQTGTFGTEKEVINLK